MKKKKVVFNKYSLFAHHSECRGANTIIKSSFFITMIVFPLEFFHQKQIHSALALSI